MKIKKHLPLWQWFIIILLAVSLPLFYTFIGDMQIEQVIQSENQQKINQDQNIKSDLRETK